VGVPIPVARVQEDVPAAALAVQVVLAVAVVQEVVAELPQAE